MGLIEKELKDNNMHCDNNLNLLKAGQMSFVPSLELTSLLRELDKMI